MRINTIFRSLGLFTLVGLLGINLSCNKESLDLQEHQTELSNNYRTTLFNVTESSELYKELGEIVKKVKFDVSPSGTAKTAFWIDYNNIVKLIDSVGNITYAVKIRADKESDKVFYNLILTERTNGKALDPFILRYEHGNEVTRATYRNSVNKRFKGKISSFSIESFVLQANLVGKDGAFDPCWQDTVDQNLGDTVGDSGSSAGSGTSGSGGSDSGGFTSTGTTGVTSGTIPTDSSGSTTYTTGGTKGTVEVGEGCFCEPAPDTQSQKSLTAADGTSCPEEEIATPINDTDDVIPPPSCKSFNFQPIGTTNWQTAYVNGIHFTAFLDKNSIAVQINYTNPIEFGAPRNLVLGGDISPGVAAEASARALNDAMWDTFQRYKNDPSATSWQAQMFFEERLKYHYPLRIPGGRINIHPTKITGTVTQYKTTTFFNDSCD